ncbi:MAG: pcaD, partial [Collimonas fungivorans]|nr:pcaD [Collimonas fungivorans]
MSYDPIDHDFERGMQNRRQILGDDWVDRSLANATGFNAEFQNLITRFAWNEIWGRPGLEQKTRRVIVLAITMALGRWEEFELHARAALLGDAETRLTPDEMKEVLIQGAIYAGVPAANTAFTHAQKILREIGAQIGCAPAPSAPAAAVHPGIGREAATDSKPALHYSVRVPRSGKAPRHTVVLSHALGCDLTMWDSLANLLAADCRVIVYDHRGHGSSDAPAGLYAIADLADDAARLLRELDSGPVIWIGLSMGGMTGQELALRHPSLVAALVVADHAAVGGQHVGQVVPHDHVAAERVGQHHSVARRLAAARRAHGVVQRRQAGGGALAADAGMGRGGHRGRLGRVSHFGENVLGQRKAGVGGRDAAIDRGLHQHFLQFVGRQAVSAFVLQRRA